jgi:hydroxymethylbilane synthase
VKASAGVARGVLTIGTRASALALTQTDHVCASLRAAHPDVELEVRHISTRGDRITDRPLAELGRNGVFVTEIEAALREGTIDLAVHSAKDLPSRLSADMQIGALLRREDPRDVLISRRGPLASLPSGARVGTSSPRRTAQLRAARPDLIPVDIRGNVDTRLRRLASGDYDALLLAAAGLIRLGRAGEITEWLAPEVMLPAVGQAALARDPVRRRRDPGARRAAERSAHRRRSSGRALLPRTARRRLRGGRGCVRHGGRGRHSHDHRDDRVDGGPARARACDGTRGRCLDRRPRRRSPPRGRRSAPWGLKDGGRCRSRAAAWRSPARPGAMPA